MTLARRRSFESESAECRLDDFCGRSAHPLRQPGRAVVLRVYCAMWSLGLAGLLAHGGCYLILSLYFEGI